MRIGFSSNIGKLEPEPEYRPTMLPDNRDDFFDV